MTIWEMRPFGFVKWLFTVEESGFREADFEVKNDMCYFWNALNWYF
jgi:hypothetical protein